MTRDELLKWLEHRCAGQHVELVEFHPERVYTLEQMAQALGVCVKCASDQCTGNGDSWTCRACGATFPRLTK